MMPHSDVLHRQSLVNPASSSETVNVVILHLAYYSALSICRSHFSSYNSWKTPHIVSVRARYGVSFVSENLTKVLPLWLLWCLHYRIIYNHNISRIYVSPNQQQDFIYQILMHKTGSRWYMHTKYTYTLSTPYTLGNTADQIINQLIAESTNSFNSLWHSDAIWHYRSGSTMAQVKACCLKAPSHYLNLCWLEIIGTHPSAISHNTCKICCWILSFKIKFLNTLLSTLGNELMALWWGDK